MSKGIKILLSCGRCRSVLKIKNHTENLNIQNSINDDKSRDALIRNFVIIGEAAHRIDPDSSMGNAQAFVDSKIELFWLFWYCCSNSIGYYCWRFKRTESTIEKFIKII